MKNCIHKIVCEHNHQPDDEECSLKDICKFYSAGMQTATSEPEPHKKRKYKKREKKQLPLSQGKKGKKGKRSDYSHLTTSDKDIRRALNILRFRKINGSLKENQTAALEMYKGIKPKKLQEHQRQQILNILNDTLKEDEDTHRNP